MSTAPVVQPSSTYTIAEAAAGLDFSAAPSLPVAVAITGGGTIDFVDGQEGVTTGATMVAGRPYPWTIRSVTGCTGSGQVQFFFDLSALLRFVGFAEADIASLQAAGAADAAAILALQGQAETLLSFTSGLAIYRPGGAASGNVYTSLAAAVAAVRDAGGGVVPIDGTLGQPVTEGTAYDLTDVELRLAAYQGGATTLDIVQGTTFTGLSRVSGGLGLNVKSSLPVMTISGSAYVFFLDGSGATTDTAGGPLISVPNGGFMFMLADQGSIFDGQGHGAVINCASGGFVSMSLGTGCELDNNTVTGAGSIFISRGFPGSSTIWAFVGATQTGALDLTKIP